MKFFIFFAVSFFFTAALADLEKPMTIINDVDPITPAKITEENLMAVETSTMESVEVLPSEKPLVEMPESHVEVHTAVTEILPPKVDSVDKDKIRPIKQKVHIKTYQPLYLWDQYLGFDDYLPLRDTLPFYNNRFNMPNSYAPLPVFRNYYKREFMPWDMGMENMLSNRLPMPYNYLPFTYNDMMVETKDEFNPVDEFVPLERPNMYNLPLDIGDITKRIVNLFEPIY